MGLIYIVTNKINGKVYVGQTIRSLNVRLNRHKSDAKNGSKLYFHNAIRKYGWGSFKVRSMRFPNHVLDKAEVSYIAKYNSFHNGYNLTTGGRGGKRKKSPFKGRPRSTSTKKKISESLKGRSGFMKGYKHTEQTRKNMSEGSKGSKPWNKNGIYLISEDGSEEYFPSIGPAEKKYKMNNNLYKILRGEIKKYKGYRARYATEE